MARLLFATDVVLTSPSSPDVQLAPGAPFTVWTDREGGLKITDVVDVDGFSALPKDSSGNFLADANGQLPEVRGPDEVPLMWRDTGTGKRYPWIAVDRLQDVLVAAFSWLASGVGGGGSGGAKEVDDTTTGDLTTWSSNNIGTKITALLTRADFVEAVQDQIGALVAAAGGTYNDTAGTISLPSGATNDSTSTSTTVALSAAATKSLITALLTRSDFVEAVQDQIGAMIAAAGGTYNDTAGTITFPSGGGSTSVPTKYVKDYGSAGAPFGYTTIQLPTDADSATVVANKLAANSAMVAAAVADANGADVDGGPGFIAMNADLAYPTGNLRLNVIHWRGNSTQGRTIRPAVRVLNLFGSEMVMDIGTVQIGPTNPVANITTQYRSTMGQLVAPGGNGQDSQGGYRNIRTTDVGEVYCKDPMPGAAETGLTNTANAATWRAELGDVHAIGLNVSSANLTAAGTVVGGYPYTSLERHIIKGASSGVTARANSWAVDQAAGTSGKFLFASVSGDFFVGEDLMDVTGGGAGTKIGVAGTMFVAFAGRLLYDYGLSVRMALANAVTPGTWTAQQITDARPRFRLMNQAQVDLDIRVKASHDVDTFLTTDERNIAAVEVNGAYRARIRVEALSGFSRNLLVRACESPDISIDVTGVANHAIGVANPNAEEGYGYGVELQGPTRYAKVHDSRGRFVRHLFTTNPNSRTWGTTAADGIPDYMGMGAGSMWAEVYDNTASACFSAPFDTHELAWGTRWRNNDVFSSFSGSRVVTAPAGYNTRGFADDYKDCRVDGTVGGFSNGGVALTSGIPYTTIYRDWKATNVQSSALSFSAFKSGLMQDQSGLLAAQQSATIMFATVVIGKMHVAIDNTLTSGEGLQFAIVCDVGRFIWEDGGYIGGFNRAPVRIKAGGMHRIEEPPLCDYTNTIASTSPFGWQLDGTSYIEMWEPMKFIRRSASVPAAAFNDVSGSSTIWWNDVEYSDMTVTAATLPAARLGLLPVKAGAGTATVQSFAPPTIRTA